MILVKKEIDESLLQDILSLAHRAIIQKYKLHIVAGLSTTQVEYVATTKASKVALLYLHKFMLLLRHTFVTKKSHV